MATGDLNLAGTFYAQNAVISGNVTFSGNLTGGTLIGITASDLSQEDLSEFFIPIENWRIWNAYQTVLTGTANTDDLALTAGAFGTATPYVSCGDINADASANRYARFQVGVPKNYVAGQTIGLNFWAGLISGTVAGTVTLDVEAYGVGSATGSNVSGSDLCGTAAQSINATTMAAYYFDLGISLSPGDVIDVRVNIAFSNNATARVPGIVYAQLLADTKG